MDDKVWKTDLGFDNVKDFYDLLSSHKNTRRIRVPMMSINSRDDPICPTHSIPKDEMQSNGNLIHIETGGGGHVEFVSKVFFPEMVSPPYPSLIFHSGATTLVWSTSSILRATTSNLLPTGSKNPSLKTLATR